jgi:uncharacterized protein (DUF305 family)
VTVRGFVTVAAVLSLAACGTAPAPAPAPAVPAPTAVSPDVNAADIAFVRALIPHHEQGVALARQGTAWPATRLLASAIVTTEQDEITRMQGWLASWHQPPAPSPAVSPAPTYAERTFVAALIAHQQEAIALARTELAQGRNRDALAFARQIDESRTAEIQQLTAV